MPANLKIAVLSDTHNRIPDTLPDLIESADEIWHLGDVCRPETLDVLNRMPSELTVVQGNNDPYFHWETCVTLERNGLRFQLQHLPPQNVDSSITALLFGHMHFPIRETLGGGTALNPGAVTGPRNGSSASYAWLSISSDGTWIWDVQTL